MTWRRGSRGSGAAFLTMALMVTLLALGVMGGAKAEAVKELRVAFDQGLSHFDPHLGTDNSELQVIYAVFDTLIRFDSQLNFLPGLAESWEFLNPTTLVLHLRRGVQFHDGTEFNAEAVKFNLERIMDPATGSVVRSELSVVESVEVVDSHTVLLNLSSPSAAILGALADRAGAMVSPTALQQMGPREFSRRPVGAGPFIFKEWVDGSHWVLERNPNHWEPDYPKLDRIVFYHFRNQESAVQAMRAGQVDLYERVPEPQVDWVRASADYELVSVDSLRFPMLYINRTDPPLNNKALRLAIAHALDRDAIARVVGGPELAAANGLFPPGYWAYDPNVPGYRYDVQKAREYLAQARATGWDGRPVRIFGNQTNEHLMNAQIIKAMLDQAGIPNELVIGDTARSNDEFWQQGLFAMSVSAWGGRPDPNATVVALLHGLGSYNPPRRAEPHGSTPYLDELIEQAAQTYDQAERAALYGEIQRIAFEEAYLIPLYFSPYQVAVRKNVVGFEPNALGKIIYRVIDLAE